MRKNKDWSDTQVVFRFTIIQVILGLAVIYGLCSDIKYVKMACQLDF